jgi:hypothetical protein
MLRSDGDPLWAIPMKMVPESVPLGERLRLPEQSAINSKLLKRTVLPSEKPLHVNHSLSVVTVSVDERTIKTFRGKHATNPPTRRTNYCCFLH